MYCVSFDVVVGNKLYLILSYLILSYIILSYLILSVIRLQSVVPILCLHYCRFEPRELLLRHFACEDTI